ncbi:amidophosphoribosyltransferase [Streptomyces sp. NPDC046805]|uniref:amidophosphoribosyltransferase n=1 Tax=Streptomyces sp. NPDC046805 TaxID=3155134 RepID=UPI0033F786AE
MHGPDAAQEACGVFGVWTDDAHRAVPLIRYGLHALQHRGQEAAGIAVSHGGRLQGHKDKGLVSQVLAPALTTWLRGEAGIGHTRYSTAGSLDRGHAQPFFGTLPDGGAFALAHNGTIADLGAGDGTGKSDSELLAELISRQPGALGEALLRLLPHVGGAWSILLLDEHHLFGARDPHGFRPLCLGALDDGGWVLASESSALSAVGARLVREVEPGELIIVGPSGPRSFRFAPALPRLCALEHVYLARADSRLAGSSVHATRRELGRELAAEAPAPGDVIVPVPATATTAALGFAERSRIPYQEGLLCNRYVGRTFIEPTQQLRDLAVRLKLSPVPDVVDGRRVVLVDDSIVRGSTTRAVIRMLREAGAAEIHLRIASPPVMWTCPYGVDIAAREELVAADRTVPAVAGLLGADSLGYLSVEALTRVCRSPGSGLCTACFTGEYPTATTPAHDRASV